MKIASQTRILAVALAIATLAACVLAAINLERERGYDVPTDGIWWVEATGGLEAQRVPLDSPGHRAGIRAGDILVSIDDHPTDRLAPLVREMFHSGIWAHATYSILRPVPHADNLKGATRLDIQVILEPKDRSINKVFVLSRWSTSPSESTSSSGAGPHRSRRISTSSAWSPSSSTASSTPGELDTFDYMIYWGNMARMPAACALPPLRGQLLRQHRLGAAQPPQAPPSLSPSLYSRRLPHWPPIRCAALLVGDRDCCTIASTRSQSATSRSTTSSRRIVFRFRYRRAESALERQQLKWLTRGTLLAVLPFTLLYVIPYLADATVPSLLTKLAGLSLVLLPLTFSWAIVRYRLMDVDLIFKRGVTYTWQPLAGRPLLRRRRRSRRDVSTRASPALRVWGLLAAIIVTGIALRSSEAHDSGSCRSRLRPEALRLPRDPGRVRPQPQLADRSPRPGGLHRRAPAADPAGNSRRRLPRHRERRHHADAHFDLAASHGLTNLQAADLRTLDVRFLDFDRIGANNHIFLDNPQQVLRLPRIASATLPVAST